MAKRNKYNAVRTEYSGRTYASKAEAARAQWLDLDPLVWFWVPQPPFKLGDDTYRPDFLVVAKTGEIVHVWAEDVKGVETPDFKRKCKLWAKYGPCKLLVIKRQGRRWKALRAVEGGADAS